MSKPTHRVVRTNAETWKETTVSRHTTARKAQETRLQKRQELPTGTSDWFTVKPIKPRKSK